MVKVAETSVTEQFTVRAEVEDSEQVHHHHHHH